MDDATDVFMIGCKRFSLYEVFPFLFFSKKYLKICIY